MPQHPPEEPVRPPITHVAVRFRGKVFSLPKPNRHHDIIRLIVETEPGVTNVDADEEDQGFLDASGAYLNRRQALVSAQENGQMRTDRPVWHGELYSENLW